MQVYSKYALEYIEHNFKLTSQTDPQCYEPSTQMNQITNQY